MNKHRDNLICEKYLLRVGWVVDETRCFDGICCYEDTQYPTKYLKYVDERNKFLVRIREVDGELKYVLVFRPYNPKFKINHPIVDIKEFSKIDRFENLFYELTDIRLEEISRVKDLRFEKLENFRVNEKYNNYVREDYQDGLLHDLYRFVNGCGNHDCVLIEDFDETYFTFYKESPFGKEYFKKYVNNE